MCSNLRECSQVHYILILHKHFLIIFVIGCNFAVVGVKNSMFLITILCFLSTNLIWAKVFLYIYEWRLSKECFICPWVVSSSFVLVIYMISLCCYKGTSQYNQLGHLTWLQCWYPQSSYSLLGHMFPYSQAQQTLMKWTT